MTDSPMPSPPFPPPDNTALRVVVATAIASVEYGEVTWQDAVHGWYAGHIEGEDECPGCDFRGQLPKHTNRA